MIWGLFGDNGKEHGNYYLGYSPPYIDRKWGIWGSYSYIPKAIFHKLKGDYRLSDLERLFAIWR